VPGELDEKHKKGKSFQIAHSRPSATIRRHSVTISTENFRVSQFATLSITLRRAWCERSLKFPFLGNS